jgi:hypothetical protein
MRPSRITLAAVVVAVAGAVTASALSFSTGSTASHGAWPGVCPRHPVALGLTPNELAAASNAVRTQTPRVFNGLTSQGHVAWHHPGVTALISVFGTGFSPGGFPPGLKGTAYYERTATRACGKATARASLVAFLTFPDCQAACAYTFAYVTRTRRGWYMWTSYRV